MTNLNNVSGESLPDYENPPVVEVALGIQFDPLVKLNPIEIGRLSEIWRKDFPDNLEQPALPHLFGSNMSIPPSIQIAIGQSPRRYWFLNKTGDHLIQLQNDRMIVNWRKITKDLSYPRYWSIKEMLKTKFEDFNQFVKKNALGEIKIDRIEAAYVNLIDVSSTEPNKLENVVRFWNVAENHHLGEPNIVNVNVQFDAPDPLKMNVSLASASGIDEKPTLSMTIQVFGKPFTDKVESALEALDVAHVHIVKSFDELTVQTMHDKWRKIN